MTPFLIHTGIAAPLLRDNVDTDQIIPSREMKTVSKTGLGEGLFAGQRYVQGRQENPDFMLNQNKFRKATILLAGKNFGCGSSREHAVWALKDYGFRAIIAESFGEIFYNNCVRNGILPLQLNAEIISSLPYEVTIDLAQQRINDMEFGIPSGDKKVLTEGLDQISMTLKYKAEIDNFFGKDRKRRPWKYA